MRPLSFVMAALLVAASASCHKKADPPADQAVAEGPVELGNDPIVEVHEDTSVAWTVAPDGNVRAQVRAKDGTVIRDNVSGKVTFGAEADAKALPMQFDATTGVLFAAGPKLEADLTPVRYSILVVDKPIEGTLHVPIDGTAALAVSAKASVAVTGPKVRVGPHGGVIQVVGRENYEIVSEPSAEVRVYLLDADFRPIVLGERSITLGVFAGVPGPGLFPLMPVEGGLYARASWGIGVDPLGITMAVRTGVSASFAMVGLLPDMRIGLGVAAPRCHIQVHGAFAGDVDADLRMRARMHADNGVRDHGAGLGRHGDGDFPGRDHGGFGGDERGHRDVGAKADARDADRAFHGGGDRGGFDRGGGKSGGGAPSGGGRSGGGKSGGGHGRH